MPPEVYRIYCLDGVGRIESADWIEAENDDQAIALLHDHRPGSDCELWQGDRLVARLRAERRTG